MHRLIYEGDDPNLVIKLCMKFDSHIQVACLQIPHPSLFLEMKLPIPEPPVVLEGGPTTTSRSKKTKEPGRGIGIFGQGSLGSTSAGASSRMQ